MVRKAVEEKEDVMEKTMTAVLAEKVEIEDMPLETMRDYRLYNEAARQANKRLRICRYQIKPCPVELHPKQRVKIARNDGSTNDIPVYLSDEKIHFDQKLKHGQIYDLPEYIVHYLAEKGNPQWDWVTLKDGSRETQRVGKIPRFSITTIYEGSY